MRPIGFIDQLWGTRRNAESTVFPLYIVAVVVAVCILPFLLNLLGVDFGAQPQHLPLSADMRMDDGQFEDELHLRLAGSFVHTILEWLAFGTALFTVSLALIHYSIARDVVTPIIGVALFCAGTMDAFHTLVADRLLSAVADNREFIPFTWALSRIFHAGILIAGASLFLLRRPSQQTGAATGGLRLVLLMSLLFGLIAYATIHLCAISARLPETYFPDWVVKRPWDSAPLILYLIAGGFFLPRLHRRHPSLFSHALIISIVPNVATQMHAAFGSKALFDNDFNIADFLKIIAYLVPLVGLMLDYRRTYRRVERTNTELAHEVAQRQRAEEQLANRVEELARSKVRSMQDAMKRDREERTEQLQRANQAWLRVARNIRERLLNSSNTPTLAGFELSGVCRPGENPGGDYLDYVPLHDGGLGIVIGDVSDRGLSSSLRMAEIRAYLCAVGLAHSDPGEVLTLVNSLLARSASDKRSVALLLARVEPGRLSFSYAAAGQIAYLVDTDGTVKTLEGTGSPLGLDPELSVPSAPPIGLKPGELVLLLTGGIGKAMPPDSSQVGMERVLEIVRASREKSAREIVDALCGAAGSFATHTPLNDDITIVVLKAVPET